MPPTSVPSLLLSRRDALISASALAASFAFPLATAHAAELRDGLSDLS